MEELKFRLARPSDFDQVVNLSKGIYNGHDYLPLEFHKWLKTDNFAVMVAVVGDKLVGLRAGYIVDDGKTCIRRAGRVLPEFRGRGVSKKLSLALDEYVRQNFPTVRRVRFVTTFNGFSANSLAKLNNIFEFEVLSYDIEEEASRRTEKFQEISTVEITTCTKEYISDVIFSSPVGQKLFPDNILLYDRLPFELSHSNFEYLLQEFENLEFYVEKCSDNSSPRSFSFGSVAKRVGYVHWTTYIYTKDVRLYEAHLLHQFKRARAAIKGRFIFVSSAQSESLSSHGRMLMEDQLQLKISDNLFELKLYIFEMDLLQQDS
ncbi:histidine N-acetyltransferase-like [Oculina patagonica]